MAYSYVTSEASGSTATFGVPFPYIDKNHVHVSVGGVEIPQSSLVWGSTSTVILPSVPASGAKVKRWRKTPVDSPDATFTGGVFDHKDLNRAILQLLYCSQEAFDAAADAEENSSAVQSVATATLNAAAASLTAAQAAADAALGAATTAAQQASDAVAGIREDVTAQAAWVAANVALANAAADTATAKATEAATLAASLDASAMVRKANNLSDLASAASARANLGIGTMATRALTISTAAPTGGVDGDVHFKTST